MELTGLPRNRQSQQGFTLIFTLIILVVMLLSAQAMMIMMRGGTTTAGNVAFRQSAVRVADVAAENAYAWVNSITSAGADLENTNKSTYPGYYATYNDADPSCRSNASVAFSPKDYDFNNDNCAMAYTGLALGAPGAQKPSNAVAVSGYTIYYVVHRMASATGACSGSAGCSGPLVTSTCTPPFSQDPSSPNYCKAGVTSTRVYYRITVKVVGARHNSRYIQTFVY